MLRIEMKRLLTALAGAGSLAIAAGACSSHPDPIIDTRGVDMTVYQQDLAECREYSRQVDPAVGMTKGAAAGAVVGAAAGAILDGNVGRSAGAGAVGGAAKSGVKAANEREDVVKNCMRYRGYRVLN
jgi:hypothetical protein